MRRARRPARRRSRGVAPGWPAGAPAGRCRARPPAPSPGSSGRARSEVVPAPDDLQQCLVIDALVIVDAQVAGVAPVVHQAAEAKRVLVVIGHRQPADARGHEVRHVGGEAAEVAEGADHPPAMPHAGGLRAVLDDAQAVALGDGHDATVMSAGWPKRWTGMMATVRSVMAASTAARIDGVGQRVDVGEHRRQAVEGHDVDRGHEGQRRHDHLAAIGPAVPLLEGLERELQRAGAAVAHGGVSPLVHGRRTSPRTRP